MNLLFVLEDGKDSCFYLFSLKDKEKKMLRISPRQQVGQHKLGDIYTAAADTTDFCRKIERLPFMIENDFFNENHSPFRVNNFLVVQKKSLSEFLFSQNETVLVSNPTTFTWHNSSGPDVMFKKGKLTLSQIGFDHFISYQEDAPGVFGVFERQEHVLRLIKNRVAGGTSLVNIAKRFKELTKLVDTNMKLSDAMKIFVSYQDTKGKKILRYNLGETE